MLHKHIQEAESAACVERTHLYFTFITKTSSVHSPFSFPTDSTVLSFLSNFIKLVSAVRVDLFHRDIQIIGNGPGRNGNEEGN